MKDKERLRKFNIIYSMIFAIIVAFIGYLFKIIPLTFINIIINILILIFIYFWLRKILK